MDAYFAKIAEADARLAAEAAAAAAAAAEAEVAAADDAAVNARHVAKAAVKAVTTAQLSAQLSAQLQAEHMGFLKAKLATQLAAEAELASDANAKYYISMVKSVIAKNAISNRKIAYAHSKVIAFKVIADASFVAVMTATAAKVAIATAAKVAIELAIATAAKVAVPQPAVDEPPTTTPYAKVCADDKCSKASKAASLAEKELKTAWDEYTRTVKTNLPLIYANTMKLGVMSVWFFGPDAWFLKEKKNGEYFLHGRDIACTDYKKDHQKQEFMSLTAPAIDEDIKEFDKGVSMAFTEPSDQIESYLELGENCSFMRGMKAGNTAKDQVNIGTADEPSPPKRARITA
jgi:hypothetical protein